MLAFLGDIHGSVRALRKQAALALAAGVSTLIQVGDFGWSEPLVRELYDKPLPLPVLAIDGNHEDFEYLDAEVPRGVTPVGLAPNLTYVPRGASLHLEGRWFGFMGGASSVDKAFRVREAHKLSGAARWSTRENLSQEDLDHASRWTACDVLVTHVPPQCLIAACFDPLDLLQYGLPTTWVDPNAVKVEALWNAWSQPALWCGHMHQTRVYNRCRVLATDELGVG